MEVEPGILALFKNNQKLKKNKFIELKLRSIIKT